MVSTFDNLPIWLIYVLAFTLRGSITLDAETCLFNNWTILMLPLKKPKHEFIGHICNTFCYSAFRPLLLYLICISFCSIFFLEVVHWDYRLYEQKQTCTCLSWDLKYLLVSTDVWQAVGYFYILKQLILPSLLG